MTLPEAKKRVADLRKQVAHHDELYYRRAQPEISDRDYDRLKRELSDLETQFPQLAAKSSPTARVGDDGSRGSRPTGTGWRCRASTTPTPRRSSGRFTSAWSSSSAARTSPMLWSRKSTAWRSASPTKKENSCAPSPAGNGEEGDDITANARTIRTLPTELKAGKKHPAPEIIEIRGEVYLTSAEFPAHQQGARGGRRGLVRQSAQSRGGHHQAARPEGSRPAQTRDRALWRWFHGIEFGRRAAGRYAESLPRTGEAVGTPDGRALLEGDGHRRGLGGRAGTGPAPAHVRLRHGRGGGEARLVRAATRGGQHVQGSALGHRLQV